MLLYVKILHTAKAWAGFLGAAVTYTVTLTPLPSWVAVIGLVLTFAAVYSVPNKPIPTDVGATEAAVDPASVYEPEHAARADDGDVVYTDTDTSSDVPESDGSGH